MELILLLVLLLTCGCRDQGTAPASTTTGTKGLSVQQISQLPELPSSAPSVEKHPVIVRLLETPRVVTEQLDMHGRNVSISCSSCHSNLPKNAERRSAESLQEFHQGLQFSHGTADWLLSCLTCHNADNYNLLRLADGTELAYRDGQKLCAQCHSKQNRDYENGAHGGMNGHWDRTRGPQFRKNCIDCHDPHSPKFPTMIPTFKPVDQRSGDTHSHGMK